jgi:hypothetical protein
LKAQLSLEIILYLSLAGLSFLFAISTASRASAGEGVEARAFGTAQFVNAVNAELIKGSSAGFSVFLPDGLCSSTLSGSSLLTPSGVFHFYEKVSATPNTLCPDGSYASFAMSYGENGASLIRDP